MSGLRVAIVGAGIGGLTAALALAEHADEITIFERRTGFGEAGAGIQLSPNASRVLIGLGLDNALRRVGTEPDRIVVRGLRHGREIGVIALAGAAARFGAPYLYVARSDLHTLLLDAVRSRGNVRLRVGRTLVALAQTHEGAEIGLEASGGGRETAAADLVVGADGQHSRLRALCGDARPLVQSGYAAFRTTVPRETVPDALAQEGGLWLGPDRHVVHYPIAGGRLVNVVAVARRARPIEGWSTPADRREVEAAMGQAAEPLRRLLEASESWSAWSLADLPALRMAAGRVALLGDAAHPALPFLAQGGALAIEDAAVLAAAIGAHGTDLDAALSRYANLRLRRVRRVQSQARRNRAAYHATGLVAFVRNRIIRATGPAGMLDRYAWLYGWRPEPA